MLRVCKSLSQVRQIRGRCLEGCGAFFCYSILQSGIRGVWIAGTRREGWMNTKEGALQFWGGMGGVFMCL